MIDATLLNRYHIESELGQGGMGMVYRARDTLLDRAVAVKVMSDSGLGTQGRDRLLKEARAAAQLNHPNIVSVYDAGEADGAAFIVMELVEGRSLYEAWPLPLPGLLAVAKQVCAALEHAHAHGIIHRDLKPENVLIAAGAAPPTVKLTDFGLARSIASRLTQEGSLVGTVFYLAPEIALGQPADGRADLYSLGVMLYELATGKLPFTGDDPLTVISQHLNAPVVPPRALQPDLPPALDSLICRLMAKDPADRPASAVETRAALERLERGEVGDEAPPSPSLLDHIVRGRLVGREREAAELRAHWRRVTQGEGHILLISGEPGIGKTRLARELISLAEVSGGRVLSGECYAEGSVPYGPIAPMLRAALLDAPADGPGLPPAILADLLTLAPGLRPHFAHVPPSPSLEPQVEQSRVFESFVTLCAAITAQAPLLLFLDDAHWADSGTLFLLRHLARRTRRQRLLTVITYRETDLDQSCCLPEVMNDLNRERLSARLKLARLGPGQTRELLAAMFQGPAADDLAEAVHRETEGNPFFIEEVCKALIEEGQLIFADGRWRATHLDEIVIPQSVRVTIQSRIGKLPEPAQETLKLAAVLGREFDFETLARASDLGDEALITALEAAERAQLIGEVRRANRSLFSFAHALIPSALREGTSRLRRQRLHRRAALAIEALRPEDYESLAYHAERAGDEDRAREYYLQAGDRALAVFANQEAEQHFRAALETLVEAANGRLPRRAQALAGLGEALYRQSRYEPAVQTWEEAIHLHCQLGEGGRAARLYARMARAAWQNGDKARGLSICRAGMTLFADAPESDGLAYLIHETGRACFFNQLYDEAQVLCQRALEIGQRLGLMEVQAEALATLGILPDQPPEAQVRLLTQSVALAEAGNLPATAIRGHINLGGAVQHAGGHLQEAHDHFLQAREYARRIGHVNEELKCLTAAAAVASQMGHQARCSELAREISELALQTPWLNWGLSATKMLEANVLRQQGDADGALRLAAEGKALALSGGAREFADEYDILSAEILLERRDPTGAEAALHEALALGAKAENAAWVHVLLAVLQAEQGRLEAARASLEAGRTELGQWPGVLGRAICGLAEVYISANEGGWEAAFSRIADIDQTLSRSGMRWRRAYLMLSWASLYRRHGTPASQARARELLTEARAIFRAMDMPHYARLADEQLAR